MMLQKIISGGQAGADRAALDVAIEYGVPHGGRIPKGRRTENGRLPDRHFPKETKNIGYPQRTELNILASDGTLIFSHGKMVGGSALTQKLATKHSRPCLHVDLNEISAYKAVEIIRTWIDVKGIKILNVAGSVLLTVRCVKTNNHNKCVRVPAVFRGARCFQVRPGADVVSTF